MDNKFIDLKQLKALEMLMQEYEEYNENRNDDLIIYTDALDDFLKYLKKVKLKNKGE